MSKITCSKDKDNAGRIKLYIVRIVVIDQDNGCMGVWVKAKFSENKDACSKDKGCMH